MLVFCFLPVLLTAQDSTQTESSVMSADTLNNTPSNNAGLGSDLPKFNKTNWKNLETEEERIEFFNKWKSADSAKIAEKMQLKPKERAVLSGVYKDLKFKDKVRYRIANRKIERKRKKHFRAQKRKFKKTIVWSKPGGVLKLQKMERSQKISMLKARNIWLARKEAYRRAKVRKHFDRKEARLRKKYKLSKEEKIILNKSMGMSLKPSEKRIASNARNKQNIFTRKLTKLRRRRQFRLQDKPTRKRIKKQLRQNQRQRQKRKHQNRKSTSRKQPKRRHKKLKRRRK